jgi:hypothetical protein
MIWWLINLLLLLSVVCGDNPTAIVPAGIAPDPGYIVAESDAGLSNRLRVLAAYMYVGESRFEGAHLVFIWDVNSACPGHFLEIFQPIPNVMFATNSSRYTVDKHSKINYENSWAVLHWTLQMNNIPKSKFGQPSWGQIEHNMYRKFVPTPRIAAKVKEFVQKHNVCNIASMHLRLTDLEDQIKQSKKAHRGINVEAYFSFVESHEKVYLLTDNPGTQKLFLDKFPDKILVYNRIDESKNKESSGKPVDFRYTSLEHTLIDVLIAAHSKNFKPSLYSSLSDLVRNFHSIGRHDWNWCSS